MEKVSPERLAEIHSAVGSSRAHWSQSILPELSISRRDAEHELDTAFVSQQSYTAVQELVALTYTPEFSSSIDNSGFISIENAIKTTMKQVVDQEIAMENYGKSLSESGITIQSVHLPDFGVYEEGGEILLISFVDITDADKAPITFAKYTGNIIGAENDLQYGLHVDSRLGKWIAEHTIVLHETEDVESLGQLLSLSMLEALYEYTDFMFTEETAEGLEHFSGTQDMFDTLWLILSEKGSSLTQLVTVEQVEVTANEELGVIAKALQEAIAEKETAGEVLPVAVSRAIDYPPFEESDSEVFFSSIKERIKPSLQENAKKVIRAFTLDEDITIVYATKKQGKTVAIMGAEILQSAEVKTNRPVKVTLRGLDTRIKDTKATGLLFTDDKGNEIPHGRELVDAFAALFGLRSEDMKGILRRIHKIRTGQESPRREKQEKEPIHVDVVVQILKDPEHNDVVEKLTMTTEAFTIADNLYHQYFAGELPIDAITETILPAVREVCVKREEIIDELTSKAVNAFLDSVHTTPHKAGQKPVARTKIVINQSAAYLRKLRAGKPSQAQIDIITEIPPERKFVSEGDAATLFYTEQKDSGKSPEEILTRRVMLQVLLEDIFTYFAPEEIPVVKMTLKRMYDQLSDEEIISLLHMAHNKTLSEVLPVIAQAWQQLKATKLS